MAKVKYTSSLQDISASANEPIELKEHYRENLEDYLHWSRGGNMHFGLWRRGVGLCNREAQVEQMNIFLGEQLQVQASEHAQVIDLGCGLGASARSLARQFPQAKITGVTLVEEQIERATQMSVELQHQVNFHCANYCDTQLPAASADGAYCLESAIHDFGAGKAGVIAEAGRLIKPGGRFVMIDCMLRRGEPGWLLKKILKPWCADWALPEMGQLPTIKAALKANGFVDIEVKELSWRLIPSLMQVPHLVLSHIWQNRRELNRTQLRHLRACLLSLPIAMHLPKLGYFCVSARKG